MGDDSLLLQSKLALTTRV